MRFQGAHNQPDKGAGKQLILSPVEELNLHDSDQFPPFEYPKIEWEEWDRQLAAAGDGSAGTGPAGQGPAAAPLFPPLPDTSTRLSSTLSPAPAEPLALAGEHCLYHLHATLLAAHAELHPSTVTTQHEIASALSYLEEKDRPRAELVRSLVQLASYALREAGELVHDGLHRPTVENPSGTETAAGTMPPASATATATPQTGEAERTASQGAKPEGGESQVPVSLAALGTPTLTTGAQQAARRSLGRSLRADCEAEKQRFYEVAREHGLRTNAPEALRAALSELWGASVTNLKDLTATQWSRAASTLYTEDLRW